MTRAGAMLAATAAQAVLAGAGACAQAPVAMPPASAVAPPLPALPGPPAPAGIQFLYGSGEGDAVYRSVWQALVRFVADARRRPHSVIAAPGYVARVAANPSAFTPDPAATADAADWTSCAGKPKAIVLDMDETVLLNGGFEYDAAMGTPYSDARWRQWEVHGWRDVEATPGAVAALHAIRAMGVTVIFNSNRLAADSDQNARALGAAGLLEGNDLRLARSVADDAPEAERRGQTLYLARSSSAADSAKDDRRAAIARHWCVIAMGGDQLGDFTDGFNPPPGQPIVDPVPRRRLVDRFAALWGNGWFAFPNPVYGTALKGSAGQIFKGREWPAAPQSESK